MMRMGKGSTAAIEKRRVAKVAAATRLRTERRTAAMIGKKFGCYQLVEVCGRHPKRVVLWRCRCDCGVEVVRRSDRLRRGASVCPHVKRPCESDAAEYRSWEHMRARCLNARHPKFKDYGGRGIAVCERWSVYENFLADMGRRPDPVRNYSIDRIDVNGNYEPGNCRWATRAEQQGNRRDTVRIEYGGRQRLLADVACEIGIARSVLYGRLMNGWRLQDVLTKPVRPKLRGRHTGYRNPRVY